MSGLQGDILHELAVMEAAGGVSGRELARRLGASPEGVRKVLIQLVRHGIVLAEETPPSRRYRLNQQHLAFAAVRDLLGLRSELFHRIAASVQTWDPPPLNLTVYGSTARGDGTPESDIDILVIGADHLQPGSYTWHSTHGAELLDQITAWTGNRAEITQYQAAEILVMAEEGHAVLESIRREGITVFGSSLDDLIAHRVAERA